MNYNIKPALRCDLRCHKSFELWGALWPCEHDPYWWLPTENRDSYGLNLIEIDSSDSSHHANVP